jgi:hypothetical protein
MPIDRGPATAIEDRVARPLVDRVLIGLEVALAIGAFGGAVGLAGGGTDLGGAVDDLPWGSALLGGLALALVNGVLPAVVAVGALRRRPWARAGHLLVGVALMGWIVVQVALIGLISWMQPFCFVWGAAILVLGLAARRGSGRPLAVSGATT